MLLYRCELDDLATVLERELDNGNRYLVTDNFPSVETSDFHFFRDKETANQFAGDNTSDRDHLSVFNIKELSELADAGIKNYWRLPDVIQTEYLITLKTEIMEENNVKYLENDLKYTGFGDRLNVQLKEKIAEGAKEFTLKDQVDIGKDKMDYFLHFKQGQKNEDLYFFNSYDAILKKEGAKEEIKQTFFQNQGITAKEAYNLLDGRSVYKTLTKKDSTEEYQAWLKIDFSEKNEKGNNFKMDMIHEKYGYDPKAELKKLPIKEAKFEDNLDRVVKDLQKGNIPAVTLEVGGQSTKIHLEAYPRIKGFKSYDENMKLESSETLKMYRELKHDDGKAQAFADELKKKESQKPEEQNEQKKGRGRRVA